jgi:hypothetical protein
MPMTVHVYRAGVRRPLARPDWFARARKPSVAAAYFTWVVLQHGAPGEWGMHIELLAA